MMDEQNKVADDIVAAEQPHGPSTSLNGAVVPPTPPSQDAQETLEELETIEQRPDAELSAASIDVLPLPMEIDFDAFDTIVAEDVSLSSSADPADTPMPLTSPSDPAVDRSMTTAPLSLDAVPSTEARLVKFDVEARPAIGTAIAETFQPDNASITNLDSAPEREPVPLSVIPDTGASAPGDIVERESAEMSYSAASSPLSDLPDLPTELPPSPTSNLRSLGPSNAPAANGYQSLAHVPSEAESSAAAARRSAAVTGTKRRAAVRGKGKDSPSYLDDQEDLNNIDGSDGDYGSGSRQRVSSKKMKMAKGEPRKSSRQVKRSRDGAEKKINGTHPTSNLSNRQKGLTDEAIFALLKGKRWDRQLSTCIRPRYGKWGKCTQCVAKIGGDSCRFRDYRIFPIDPETAEITGPGHFEDAELDEPMTPLPTVFNAPFGETEVSRTERTVAPFLLPVITRELRHVMKNKAIKRGMDTAKHRSLCDFCSSTIFAGYFFCKRCGRDFCLQCERYFADSPDTMMESPWPMSDASRPRLARCNAVAVDAATQADFTGSAPSAAKKPAFHFRPDLQPVSRFSQQELQEHWRAILEYVLKGAGSIADIVEALRLDSPPPELLEEIEVQRKAALLPAKAETLSPRRSLDVQRYYTRTTNDNIPLIPDPAELESESLPFIRAHHDELDNEKFDELWGRGEPMVVDGVGRRLRMEWTPDEITRRFGSEVCFVQNCQTNASYQTTVSDFFDTFKMPEADRPDLILKLKDWPATEDFQKTHPGLYNDFCDALPVPDFTRREGVLNLYAHFPNGPTRPDIGPKMYNAFDNKRAMETEGGFGSTRLHMDVADAVNLMLFASSRPDGQPGCAVWDLFRAEDADKIRQFLKQKFDETHTFTDPIHAQLFYLDSKLRRELWDKHGVASFRVYQYPGQAVFIPAGCAHQVCNLADCIKIALDFVSPHNVVRCQQLTKDFRDENFIRAWKQDVLQLYNVLWFAWLSCGQTRDRWRVEDIERREAEEARKKRLDALQNGDRDVLMGVPTRPGFMTAVSSVRDEIDYSRSSSPALMPPINGTSASADHRQQPMISTDPATISDTEEPKNAALSSVKDSAAYYSSFFDRILDAAVTSPDPPPPTAPRAPSAATKVPGRKLVALAAASMSKSASLKAAGTPSAHMAKRVSRSSKPPPRRYADLCKSGALPLDMMMSVARAELGEGAGTSGDWDTAPLVASAPTPGSTPAAE